MERRRRGSSQVDVRRAGRGAVRGAAGWSAMALVAGAVAVPAVAIGPASVAFAAPAGFSDRLVAHVDAPTAVESLPDGRIVVLEQDGRVLAGQPGQPLQPILELANTCSGGERGLLGFTADPAFLTNSLAYVYYTRDAPEAPGGCVNRVSRFDLRAPGGVAASEVVLLDNISSVNGNHNGGDLDIGSDGFLYVGVGDAGSDPRGDSGSGSSNNAARDWSLLNGKILRITLDGQPAPGNPLSVPGSAPCATRGNLPDTPTSMCQEIYAWGLRNPYRFAFDPNGGADRFFINDVGQSTREEVNEGGLGRDYAWNACEGPCAPGAGSGFTNPITWYPRSIGTYITAGAFVPDGLWPEEYDGAYLFADGGTGRIWVMDSTGAVDYDEPFTSGVSGIADMTFAFDQAGRLALYYTLNSSDQLRALTWDAQAPSATPSDLAFAGVTPFRAYDTRNSIGVDGGNVRSDTTRLVDLDPPDGTVRAALVNLTFTDNAGYGFLSAWSPRALKPATSVLNVVNRGEDVANAAVVVLDDEGRFVVHTSTSADVLVDVLGWFRTTPGSASAGRFVGVEPGRLVDTRQPAGAVLDSGSDNPYTGFSSGTTSRVDVAGRLGLPPRADIQSVVVSLTAIGRPGASAGYVTVGPGGAPMPDSSNVNVNGDVDVRANLAVVPLGGDGSIGVTPVRVDDFIVDVVGYFTSASAPSLGTGLFTATSPVRLYDERSPGAPPAPDGASLNLDIGASIPAADGAVAVLQNLTLTDTEEFGYVTAYPYGPGLPVVSNVNATAAGQTRAALAVTRIGSYAGRRAVSYHSSGGSALIIDVFGVFEG